MARDADGTAWIVGTARVIADGGCTRVVVVVGAAADEVRAELAGEPVAVVEAADWVSGMSASLRCGLAAVEQYADATAALVVPVDLPNLTAEAVRRIVAGAQPAVLVRGSTYRCSRSPSGCRTLRTSGRWARGRTDDDRLRRLGEAGLTESELARLASRIGLDLGARTPEETAVSIAAEIIALRWGGAGDRLSHHTGPIHHH